MERQRLKSEVFFAEQVRRHHGVERHVLEGYAIARERQGSELDVMPYLAHPPVLKRRLQFVQRLLHRQLLVQYTVRQGKIENLARPWRERDSHQFSRHRHGSGGFHLQRHDARPGQPTHQRIEVSDALHRAASYMRRRGNMHKHLRLLPMLVLLLRAPGYAIDKCEEF